MPTACLRQSRVKIPLNECENGEAEDIKILALRGIVQEVFAAARDPDIAPGAFSPVDLVETRNPLMLGRNSRSCDRHSVSLPVKGVERLEDELN